MFAKSRYARSALPNVHPALKMLWLQPCINVRPDGGRTYPTPFCRPLKRLCRPALQHRKGHITLSQVIDTDAMI